MAPPGDGPPAMPAPPDPGLPACKRTVMASGGLAGAISGAMPGDCILVPDGQYAGLSITAKGSEAAPIVIRAANRLKAAFTGTVTITGSSYVVLEGFHFPGSAGTAIVDSDHCRVSRGKYEQGPADVHGNASWSRIDHNEFGPKTTDGNMARPTGLSTNTLIDHNYFHDVSPAGGNGRETIRLGCCGATFDYHEAFTVVEYNLLVNCSGEAEMISIKSSANTVRYNTIRKGAGTVTLRAGRKNQIYGNFIFGIGIRMYEDDHKIFNNYVQAGTTVNGNGGGAGHAVVRRALIVHNTFVGNVSLSGEANVFSSNIVTGTAGVGGAMALGNLVGPAEAAGLTMKGEILAITGTSKAVDAAMGSFPFVTDDLDGQVRDKPDVGADEWSTAPAMALRRPLTPADVGPDAP
jgi:hypothetical protein